MAESDGAAHQNGEPVATEEEISAVTQKARDVVAEIEAEERKELEELRSKQKDPPITFKDAVDVKDHFNALVSLVDGKLNDEEKQSLEELKQYMILDEGSWALGDGFLNFVGKLLHDESFSKDVKIRLLNVLAAAALKDDVILLLHQDRRDHVLMNYAGNVERITVEEQQALSLMFANLFENLSTSEWLLYISEWEHNNSSLSNIRVTTKVGINALLSENPVLQDRGSAIVHNMACKEVKTVVFDDVAVELTMALLQFLNNNPSEEYLFRALKSLARFCQISGQEVTQLIQMIGPDPKKFKGKSQRIDEQIGIISTKLR
ncbi:conserved hypothetical protein [Pediculus humanus corporis]|uniref:Uncharacterized protein n=1 Tax=Pediculus humanus subsp. corporis TaxID=121224 RepID=E0VTA1_PEDHC|nr:uncharacterized protein Phum_PHUM429720 [Pediculus humanus corporis]EEB16607.1 conserved hypothetical protein [Pediculus humanus corporis]